MHQHVIGNNDGRIALKDDSGIPVSVQYPLPVDGDRVYAKDVKDSLNDIGTFLTYKDESGTSRAAVNADIETLFTNLDDVLIDDSATNPKWFEFFLEAPVNNGSININTKEGDFSNVKITLKNRQNTTIKEIDDSANNTDYENHPYPFTTKNYCCIRIEFHTADTVSLSGIFIQKNISVVIDSIDGFISDKNSSLTPLGIAGVFQGEAEDSKDFGSIQVALFSDQACTFLIESRATTSSTWREIDTYAVLAGQDKAWSFQGVRRFVRVSVTNGAIAQTDFDLQTVFKPVYIKPSSHPIGGTIKNNDDAELVKAQITGERPDGDYGNVAVTNGNNLKQSLEEFDTVFNSLPLPVVDPVLHLSTGQITGITHSNKYGQAIDGVQTTATDIWDRADAATTQQIWLAPTAARIHTIVSTSTADDGTPEGAGASAQAVRVWYLPDWDTVETFEDVILNGTTGVVMTNAAVIIHRMKVIPVGSTYAINAGIITATAAVDATVTAQINIGQGQTNMAIYGVPSIQTAYATGFSLNSHNSVSPATDTEVDFTLLANEHPDLNTLTFINKGNLGTVSSGSTFTPRKYNPYRPIPGPAILKIQAVATSSDIEGVAEFDLILVDN